MDWYELDNLTAIHMALIIVGLIGAADLAIGHLSGLALTAPCALLSIFIHVRQTRR
jgi:hypothetical protein